MKTKSLKPHIVAPVKRENVAVAAQDAQASVDPSGRHNVWVHAYPMF